MKIVRETNIYKLKKAGFVEINIYKNEQNEKNVLLTFYSESMSAIFITSYKDIKDIEINNYENFGVGIKIKTKTENEWIWEIESKVREEGKIII